MKKILFDDKLWKADEAIVNLFFSHLEVDWSDLECVNALGAFVHCKIDGRRHDGSLLSRSQKDEIESVVGKVKKQFATFGVEWVDSPLAWLRFAFQAMIHGISPSENYLKSYAIWRERRAKKHGVERIHLKAVGANGRKGELNALATNRKSFSCTIDRFLLDVTLRAGPDSGVICELRPGQAKSAVVSPNLEKSGHKTQKSKGNGPKDIRDIVGVNVYKLVGECVEAAARFPVKTHVGRRNKTGRHESDLSRIELVALLRKHYADLKNYSSNTISRALPDFVACPNYRRKKIAGFG